jgi:hypothetical protein
MTNIVDLSEYRLSATRMTVPQDADSGAAPAQPRIMGDAT